MLILEPTLEQPPASVTRFNRTDIYLIFRKITTIKLKSDVNYLVSLRPDFADTLHFLLLLFLSLSKVSALLRAAVNPLSSAWPPLVWKVLPCPSVLYSHVFRVSG